MVVVAGGPRVPRNEEAFAGILSESLATCRSDLEAEGFLAKVRPWTPGTVDELMAWQIHRSQIGRSPYFPETLTYNLEASFRNMFSCQAARFTVPCIGMAMVFQTDFGLAVVGSTKNGGIWSPYLLHESLAFGETWGEAFRFWYNNYGYSADQWHLGMVLFGDPLLTVTSDVTGLMDMARRAEPTPQDVEALRQSIVDRPEPEGLDTYEQYRKENPQFFE